MGLPHVTLLPPFCPDCLSFGVPDIFHQATVAMLSLFAFLLLFFAPGTTCRGSEWGSGVVAGIWEPQTVPIFTRYMHAKSCHVCVCMICFFTRNKSQMTLPYGILARARSERREGLWWLLAPEASQSFFCSLQLKFFNFFKSSWTSVNSTTIKFVRGQNLFPSEKKGSGKET